MAEANSLKGWECSELGNLSLADTPLPLPVCMGLGRPLGASSYRSLVPTQVMGYGGKRPSVTGRSRGLKVTAHA